VYLQTLLALLLLSFVTSDSSLSPQSIISYASLSFPFPWDHEPNPVDARVLMVFHQNLQRARSARGGHCSHFHQLVLIHLSLYGMHSSAMSYLGRPTLFYILSLSPPFYLDAKHESLLESHSRYPRNDRWPWSQPRIHTLVEHFLLAVLQYRSLSG